MRFLSPRDYQTIIQVNQELVNKVVDTTVVVYKMNQTVTVTNSYGEAPKKTWFPGVQIPALIDLKETQATSDMSTINTEQPVEIAFLRYECQQRNIYPELGDIIDWNNNYFEIHNTNEIQLIVGQTQYNHSIVCSCHLSTNSALQLEPPQL